MNLRYLSVCSGVEAASLAWRGLGWSPFAFAEVRPFQSAVLASRFPAVPNLGNIEKINANEKVVNNELSTLAVPDGGIDLFVGGTPCQSFSSETSAAKGSRGRADWHYRTFEFFETCARAGLCGKTLRARYIPFRGENEISTFFSLPLRNAGMMLNGECLTLALPLRPAFLAQSRREGPACSLSDVVQDSPPSRSFVTPQRLAATLRRVSRFMPTTLVARLNAVMARFAQRRAETSSEQ